MATIKVPKTPKKAFNKNRRPSALLLNQIAHLEWAVLPASRRKPHQLPTQQVKTEAQAAERVGQPPPLVLAERAAAAAPASGPAALGPARLPPLPPVPKSSSAGRRQAAGKSVGKTRRTAGRQRTRRR